MTDSELQPVDHAQRAAAIDPKRCVCVTAPAGAGKTQLLTQRVLTLLATADQPEEILAITFTRKAAAEMHHRIIQALHLGKEAEPAQAHNRLSWQLAKKALARDEQCHWQLLSNPTRLKIQTIDSLCASLTKQMPILANFGAQPQIAENAQLYYRTAVHNFLRQLEGDNAIAADLENLLSHVDNDIVKVERLLIELLQRRDQWLLHIGIGINSDTARRVLEHTLTQVIEDVLSTLKRSLAPFSTQLLPLLDYAASNLHVEKTQSPITTLAGITHLPSHNCTNTTQWCAIAELLLTKTGEWRKSINKRCGFPTQTQDGDKKRAKELKDNLLQLLAELSTNESLLSSLHGLRYLPNAAYNAQQWTMLESLTRLLPSLVAQLTLVFQQYGEVDYSQMAIAALQALGDASNPSELALKLDYQLRHILVDEFQDTASTQFTLLERLVEGWHEHNVNNPERPNTLFIVGDGMQSIYGFREANVGLFLGARKQGINGLQLEDLPLTVNFRSTPTIVEWVNKTFSEAFPKVENLSRGAVPFEYAHAFKPHEDTSTVEVLGFIGEQSRISEAQKTVEIAQQVQQKNPQESIAILVRSRSHLLEIIPAFIRAGITWNATDIDPLSNVSSIIDLLSLTKALLNTADRISWAALLRTPWIGLTDSDLHGILSSVVTEIQSTSNDQAQPASSQQTILTLINDPNRLLKLSRHARHRLPVVSDILNTALDNRQRLPVRSWVEGVWLQLGGAASLSQYEEFAAIDDYFDLLEQYQQGELLSAIDEFEQAVMNLYAAPVNQHSSLQVMTIHKSKGLEFDTVILPAMARPARSDNKSLLMWREYLSVETSGTKSYKTVPGLVISPLGASGSEEDSIYQYLRYEQAQSSVLENTRLFYVAATRAVKQLYILYEAQRDEKSDEVKVPAKNSLLNSAWDALKLCTCWHGELKPSNEQIGLDFGTQVTSSDLKRLPADWKAPDWTYNNPLDEYYLTAEYYGQEEGDNNNQPVLVSEQLARCVGTVTHRILEQLVSRGSQFWLTMPERSKQHWLKSLLHHFGLAATKWPQAISDITRALNNTVNDQIGRWILTSSHSQSLCEWELLACFPAGVKHRVIDRSFVDKEGVCWIIDYKTSHPHENEPKEAFIEREIQTYRNQLTEYASYLSMLDHQSGRTRTIKTALYFTYYPHWQELST